MLKLNKHVVDELSSDKAEENHNDPPSENVSTDHVSINNHIQTESGSAAERLFQQRKNPRLPKSNIRQLNQNALFKIKSDKQMKIARKKRSSKKQIKGTVKQMGIAQDNSTQSFKIESGAGTVFVKNKSDVKNVRSMNAIRRVARFADEGEQA